MKLYTEEGFWRRIGSAVRERRKQRGLTQRELAELTGLPRGAISQLENGWAGVSAYRVYLLCAYLGAGVHPLGVSETIVGMIGERLTAG